MPAWNFGVIARSNNHAGPHVRLGVEPVGTLPISCAWFGDSRRWEG